MTLNEYEKLTDTDKAFLKIEGRCKGCGCMLKDQVYIAHAEWCLDAPQFIWPKINTNQVKLDTAQSRQLSKSVFNHMLNEFNKMFRNKNENTNSR